MGRLIVDEGISRKPSLLVERLEIDVAERRIYYSAAQRSEIWDRWQAGEPMSAIGRRFDRETSSVFSVISPTGGIRPPDRRRSEQTLSLSEREEISRWLSMRRSLRSIATHLGRSASTISREVHRNGGSDCYRAARSDQAAWDRARRPKLCKLACRPFLRRPGCGGNGHRSKSPAGSSAHIRGSLESRCHTRRSIGACSFKRGAC